MCEDIAQDPLFLPGLTTTPLVPHGAAEAARPGDRHPRRRSEQLGRFTQEDRQFAEIFTHYIAMALHILDLLVVKRSTVNKAVTGRIEGGAL